MHSAKNRENNRSIYRAKTSIHNWNPEGTQRYDHIFASTYAALSLAADRISNPKPNVRLSQVIGLSVAGALPAADKNLMSPDASQQSGQSVSIAFVSALSSRVIPSCFSSHDDSNDYGDDQNKC